MGLRTDKEVMSLSLRGGRCPSEGRMLLGLRLDLCRLTGGKARRQRDVQRLFWSFSDLKKVTASTNRKARKRKTVRINDSTGEEEEVEEEEEELADGSLLLKQHQTIAALLRSHDPLKSLPLDDEFVLESLLRMEHLENQEDQVTEEMVWSERVAKARTEFLSRRVAQLHAASMARDSVRNALLTRVLAMHQLNYLPQSQTTTLNAMTLPSILPDCYFPALPGRRLIFSPRTQGLVYAPYLPPAWLPDSILSEKYVSATNDHFPATQRKFWVLSGLLAPPPVA